MAELLLNGENVSEEIQTLANEPLMVATKYNSYTINGHNFHTKSYDEGRSVQCSGVALVAQTSSFSSGNNNPMVGNKNYYGVITEILELDYKHKGSIVLFKCDWVDNRAQDKWVKVDKFGITDVNFKHLFNSGAKLNDEPFILASQATQVYYVEDPIDNDWCAVIQSKSRDFYDMAEIQNGNLECENEHVVTYPDIDGNITITVDAGEVPRIRPDIDGIIVDANDQQKYVILPFHRLLYCPLNLHNCIASFMNSASTLQYRINLLMEISFFSRVKNAKRGRKR